MEEPIDLASLFPDRSSGEKLGVQLVRSLRGAIEGGLFPRSARLLPSRELAKRLGVARNTVTAAIDQLIAEGYLEARIGAGTFVSATISQPRKRSVVAERLLPPRARMLGVARAAIDAIGPTAGPLRIGVPDLEPFPMQTWRRLCRDRISDIETRLDYGQTMTGTLALREAISHHIAQFRGVVAEPERIVVVGGAQAAFHLITGALTYPGDRIAIEDPCYQFARAGFLAQGLELCAVPVDDDGLCPEFLPEAAALAYVTPSHQFPLGGALSLARRREVLAWAHRSGAYVIEDDYDSEFDTHPLPALQSLDRDERVIYVGTLSKTMSPLLRLGYVVVPPHLVDTFRLARGLATLGTPGPVQEAVAEFMRKGYFARHVRRMTAIYERRRNVLVDALRSALPASMAIGPAQRGLHVSVIGAPDFDDVRAARTMPDGQRFWPLSRLCVSRTDTRGVLLGFGAGADAAIAPAARAFAHYCAS